MKCKNCNQEFKNVLVHIKKSSKCKKVYSDEELENLKASQKEIRENQPSQQKENKTKEKCKSCQGEFKSLLKHIARSKKCQNAYSDEEKTQMKSQKRKNYEETHTDEINQKQARYDLRNRDQKKKYDKAHKAEKQQYNQYLTKVKQETKKRTTILMLKKDC